MRKTWKTGLLGLFFFLPFLGVIFISPPQKAMAGTYDSAKSYYDRYGEDIVFKDGYFYFGTKGKEASASKNTTHWGTIGYRINVKTDSKSTNIYFELSGPTVENVDESTKDGYVYDLYRINIRLVKSKLADKSETAAKEFAQEGGKLEVDSCMITIKFDKKGKATRSGSMDADGNFTGSVYTSYDGIANAAPWSDPSSLHSFFNKKITYETELKSRQIVYVRYQDRNGGFGDYHAVINQNFVYGETVSWSRAEDACYNAASISYIAKQDKTSYISVTRKQYVQRVYVKYQNAEGNYDADWTLVDSTSLYYEDTYGWSYAGDVCYNAASVAGYTVTNHNNHYIYISRKKYTVSVSAGTGISEVFGGGSYYYDATCTVNATVKPGYTWSDWSGTYSSGNQSFTFAVKGDVNLTAKAEANTYYIVFHPNGGSGSMQTMTCKYDQTYYLPAMSFAPPSHPCIYIGWNTDADAFSPSYHECQQIRNLTTMNGYTFHFYAIWDYAPELTCKDRYFTLYEAKTGVITEEELLRTVKSTDREDGTTQIHVSDYDASKFTGCSAAGKIIITYTTKDSRNNVTDQQATVTIVDTGDTKEGPMDFDGRKNYARFISSIYDMRSYMEGGLEYTSMWKTEVSYQNVLATSMSNVKGADGNWSHVTQTWEFTKEDINQVKQFVSSKGMGNSKTENGLDSFINQFLGCKK